MKKFKHLLIASIMCLASLVALLAFYKAPTKVEASVVAIPDGQTLDTNVDTISVKDLTIGSITGQSMIGKNTDTDATFSYSSTNTNKSLIYKFKYEVNDTTATDSNAVNIYLVVSSDKWQALNNLWIRGDGVYLRKYSGDSFGYDKTSALTAGLHEIEYGRIALLNSANEPTGNYYVYYKLDGVELSSGINPYTVGDITNKIFLNFSAGNTRNGMYDAGYNNTFSYEAPQYISVRDLVSGTTITNNASSLKYPYSLDEAPTNKSVVFAAKMNYRNSEDKAQIYIYGDSGASGNTAGYIWIQSNKVYYGKTAADGSPDGNQQIDYTTLTDNTTYDIEYGRLAIMNGDTFSGQYHVYFKLNGVYMFSIDHAIINTVSSGGYVKFSGTSGFTFDDAFTFEEAKQISVSDLRANNRFVGNTYTINSNTDFTYDNTDHKPNYSLVFKFGYDVLETNNNQFHFSCTGRASGASQDYKWDYGGCFILVRGSGAKGYLGKSTSTNNNVGAAEFSCTMTAGNSYNVEYGRIAVMYGDIFTGKYYTYVKVGDSIVKDGYYGIPEVCVQGNLLFVTSDGHNRINDINQDAQQLETPDEISVGDLKLNGNRFGNVVALDANHNFSYTATAAHKSVVFKFKYEVIDPSTVGCQFHFADRYSEDYKMYAGMLWLRNDKTFLRVENAKYAESSYKFTAAGTYNVEFGKIYVTAGAFTGRYYVYLKIEDTLILRTVG